MTRGQRLRSLLGLIVLCCGVVSTTHVSASPRSEICRQLDRTPRVYLLGSSTMGSVLGPMLQHHLEKRWGIKAKRWGKASSGLARPDFHDWPAEVPNLMRRHRPDYVVVSLGTNDHQALKTRKSWVKTKNPRWAKTYKQRVLIMLRRLSGRDRRRAIVWLGPTNFDARNARILGPTINRLIREAIEEFDGPAVFVDARKLTSSKKGEPGTLYEHPKRGQRPMRADDGIHLTTEAVRWLMAEPVLKALGSCWDQDVAARDAIREARKAERMAKRKARLEAARLAREEARKKREAARKAKQEARKQSKDAAKDAKPTKADKPAATSKTSDGPATQPAKAETPKVEPHKAEAVAPNTGRQASEGDKAKAEETKASEPRTDKARADKPEADKPEADKPETGATKGGKSSGKKSAADTSKTDAKKAPPAKESVDEAEPQKAD